MKTKHLVLSLMATTILNFSTTFAKNYLSIRARSNKEHNFELLPVKATKTKGKNTIEHNGQNYLPLGRANKINLNLSKPERKFGENLEIKFSLDQSEQKKLSKLFTKYRGKKMALFYNGDIVYVPAASSQNDHFELKTKSTQSYLELVNNLNS